MAVRTQPGTGVELSSVQLDHCRPGCIHYQTDCSGSAAQSRPSRRFRRRGLVALTLRRKMALDFDISIAARHAPCIAQNSLVMRVAGGSKRAAGGRIRIDRKDVLKQRDRSVVASGGSLMPNQVSPSQRCIEFALSGVRRISRRLKPRSRISTPLPFDAAILHYGHYSTVGYTNSVQSMVEFRD
jgi:hypothetical protein